MKKSALKGTFKHSICILAYPKVFDYRRTKEVGTGRYYLAVQIPISWINKDFSIDLKVWNFRAIFKDFVICTNSKEIELFLLKKMCNGIQTFQKLKSTYFNSKIKWELEQQLSFLCSTYINVSSPSTYLFRHFSFCKSSCIKVVSD